MERLNKLQLIIAYVFLLAFLVIAQEITAKDEKPNDIGYDDGPKGTGPYGPGYGGPKGPGPITYGPGYGGPKGPGAIPYGPGGPGPYGPGYGYGGPKGPKTYGPAIPWPYPVPYAPWYVPWPYPTVPYAPAFGHPGFGGLGFGGLGFGGLGSHFFPWLKIFFPWLEAADPATTKGRMHHLAKGKSTLRKYLASEDMAGFQHP